MPEPDFRVITTDSGEGVTYTCGCPCVPTAAPTDSGAGHEHCCCGKVHFVGPDAAGALESYLAERKATKKREPEYTRGATSIQLGGSTTEVAWAFPVGGAD